MRHIILGKRAISYDEAPSAGIISEQDSPEEAYFDWWAEEAKKAGLIADTFLLNPIKIFDGIEIHALRKLKTKEKWETKNLLNAIEYTPDRLIQWNKNAEKLLFKNFFYQDSGAIVFDKNANLDAYFFAFKFGDHYWSLIDIKPAFAGPHNDSAHTFPIKRAMLWETFRVYVQKVVLFPSGAKKASSLHLFPSTFTPQKFMVTNVSGKFRKIHFSVKSINEFMK